ncbi:hypothetical protein [Elioraea sp.]|uniref:hypothetical protein n=1 Tax=Elioraea sp. TaxID=2185103 RepID=UPI003F6FF607
MRRAIRGWAAVAACSLLVSGCGMFSGSGVGFGGFGTARAPSVPADSYTQARMAGAEGAIQPLEVDTSVEWPRDTVERASIFETEEERRARARRERQVQRPRGSPAPAPAPQAQRRDPAEIIDRVPPRELAAPEPERRGQGIPGAPPGTVTTGGTGRTGTFGGPAGSGTTVRDGGTMTLMGADGQIRTVPAPR